MVRSEVVSLRTSCFFALCARVAKHVLLTHLLLFCLVFAFLRDHASTRTHRNRSTSTCTHSHHFLPNYPKHDVRGNFPGHRTQFLTFETLNDPFLPCLCGSRSFCTPTHPSAPIHTHLYHFLPICNVFLQCIYVNLIEK